MSSDVVALRGRSSVGEIVRQRAWTVSVWAGMTVWTGVLFVVVRDAYESYRLGRFDLGNMVQAVWSTAHGHPLEMTHGPTGEQGLRLGIHVDPFLALLSPLGDLALSARAGVRPDRRRGAGALPGLLAALGVERLFDRLGGLLALAYLAYPWVATSATGAIHPVIFAITFLLFCVWFLETDRLVPFVVFRPVDDVDRRVDGPSDRGARIWYALAHPSRLAGGAVMLLGLAWTMLAIYVIVPASAWATACTTGSTTTSAARLRACSGLS